MTRDFQSRVLAGGEHPVDYFWRLLDQLTIDNYPPGVVPAPGHDDGTEFFSAAAGLVRCQGEPLPPFPFGGVMFVGHNLDSINAYRRRREEAGRSAGDPDSPPMVTWQRIYKLLDLAGVDRANGFFTNVYVGMKEGDNPSGPFPGRADPSFCAWCEAFIDEQIRTMGPVVACALGAWAQGVTG